jgi:hypothetical protein
MASISKFRLQPLAVGIVGAPVYIEKLTAY